MSNPLFIHISERVKNSGVLFCDVCAASVRLGVSNATPEHRPKTLKALTSEEGILLRMNRSTRVEGYVA